MISFDYCEFFYNFLNNSDSFSIYRHENPDMDAYGSQMALFLFIKENYNKKKIYLYGELIEHYFFIYKNYINYFNNNIQKNSSIIVLDTANKERIDTKEYLDDIDLLIDHHPSTDKYADKNIILPYYPATCLILLDLFLRMKNKYDMCVSKRVLEYLYMGIISDTGMFSYGNLNKYLFNLIGFVYEKIDTKKIISKVFDKSLIFKKFEAKMFEKIKILNKHFGYIDLYDIDFIENDIDVSYSSSIVSLMRNIKEINIWATFTHFENLNFIKCSLRSKNIDLLSIAKEFGGGGHKFAVGIKIHSYDKLELLKNRLSKMV